MNSMITKTVRNVVVLAVVLSFPCAASAWDSYRGAKGYDTRHTKSYYTRHTKDHFSRDSKFCFKYPESEHNKTHSVPDGGGTTLLLLGTALTGIGAAKRFMKI